MSNRTLHLNGSRPVEFLGIIVAMDGIYLLSIVPFFFVVDMRLMLLF